MATKNQARSTKNRGPAAIDTPPLGVTPILHGTALCPLLRFPRGGKLRLKVVMDADLSLAGKDLLFAARARHATQGGRPLFRSTLAASEEAWSLTGNTAELTLTPDAIDETEGSELTLADLQEGQWMLWRWDVLDEEGLPILRLQGDMEWIQEEGAWPDEPPSNPAIPTLNVSIVEGVATVTVALISDGGVSLTNESVNTAIAEDPAATRTALELGTAATQASSTFATAAQGVKADSAVQPNTSASLATLRVDPTGVGDSFTTPTLRIGTAVSGFAAVGTIYFGVIVNGITACAFDTRGGSNPVLDVGWPYIAQGIWRPVSYTVGTVPDVATYNRCAIWVSNDVGGPTWAFSDGTNWRRFADRAVLSTT